MDFKINYSCPICRNGIRNASGDLENDEIVQLRCDNGHETTAFLTIPRFVIYFNKGVESLANQYYYEGYSWIYTALEVYRKDFVKASISILNNVDIDVIDKTFDTRFRTSENIYGAYAFAYLLHFGITPDIKGAPHPILQNEEIKRRNEMFHAGKLPTLDNVLKDCFKIYQHMFHGHQNFKDSNGVSIIMEYFGRRYDSFVSKHSYNDNDVLSRKFIILGSDLGVFDFNLDYGEDTPYKSIGDLIEEVRKREFFYNTKE